MATRRWDLAEFPFREGIEEVFCGGGVKDVFAHARWWAACPCQMFGIKLGTGYA